MDKKELHGKVREYARNAGMFSVAMVMREFDVGYIAARSAIEELVEDKRAELREGVMFEYIGADRNTLNIDDYVKALESMGDTLDPLFCDALVKCAKAGKVSVSIVQCELNILLPRAKTIAQTMSDLGFCPSADAPVAMRVSAAEAEEIVNKYRLSHIIVATDDSNEPELLWDEKALRAAVLVEIEHLCRRLSENTPSEWKTQAQLRLTVATEADDKKNIELAKAVLDYVEQNSASDNGKRRLFLECKRQELFEKMSYELAGVSGDYLPVKAEVQKRILRLFVQNPKKSDAEIVELAKKTAAVSAEAKSLGFIEDRLVANELAAFTALDFYIIRKRAKAEIDAWKKEFENAHHPDGIDVDIAFVIDATSSMVSFIEKFKRDAETFYTKLRKASDAAGRPINKLRLRLIDFADYDTEGDDAIHQTDFFTMPEENMRFVNAVNALEYEGRGGSGLARNGFEALFTAIKSDWNKSEYIYKITWQVIVILSDSFPLALQERAGCLGYDADGYPSNLAEMSDIWEQAGNDYKSSKLTKGKRLILFVPQGTDVEGHTWTDLFSWSKTSVINVDFIQGLEDIEIEHIISKILRS